MSGVPLIIRAEEIEDEEEDVQTLRFVEIVDRERPDLVNQFIRLRRDGRQPSFNQPKSVPEVPAEEIHKRRLEKLERDTYQKAFAAGEKAGLEMGEQRMQIMLEETQQFLMQMQDIPNQVMTEVFSYSEELLVETAIMLVKELLGHELMINPQGIIHRVRQVLQQVSGRTNLVLFLNARDAETMASMPEFPHLTTEVDPEMPLGSVRLETDFGGVENRIDLQLQAMETILREHLHSRLEEIRQGVVGAEEESLEASQ